MKCSEKSEVYTMQCKGVYKAIMPLVTPLSWFPQGALLPNLSYSHTVDHHLLHHHHHSHHRHHHHCVRHFQNHHHIVSNYEPDIVTSIKGVSTQIQRNPLP